MHAPALLRRSVAIALACLAAGAAQAETVTVFAAASLKNAMDEIGDRYEADTGNSAVVSLAGSSALARQIQAGVHVKIIQSRVGHSSPAFTLAKYGHLMPGMDKEAAFAYAKAMSG